MPTCVVVLSEAKEAYSLSNDLLSNKAIFTSCQLVPPKDFKKSVVNSNGEREYKEEELPPVEKITFMEEIELLNPKISRKKRQKYMAKWLIPFGLITGLSFTQMTGLQTFSKLGFGTLNESVIGSILGMISGWIGSYFAAASVNSDKNGDIRSLQKRNEEGFWLLIVKTPLETELPWLRLQKSNPLEIVGMSDQ
mgnify:CR=1 FL=1